MLVCDDRLEGAAEKLLANRDGVYRKLVFHQDRLAGALLYDLRLFRRLLVAGVLLVGYWAAIKFIPVPGMGIGALEERRNLLFHLNLTYFNGLHLWGLPSVVPTAALISVAVTPAYAGTPSGTVTVTTTVAGNPAHAHEGAEARR